MKYAVIGGGMLGLTIAYLLSKKGKEVLLIEASSGIGGQASVWEIGQIIWDKNYHVISPQDKFLLSFLSELGLKKTIQWRSTNTSLYTQGKLYPFNSIKDFITFPLISFCGKIRLAITILHACMVTKSSFELSAREWLLKWSGEEVTKLLWLPLLRAKFGEAAENLSSDFIRHLIRRMYLSRGKTSKKQLFGYAKGGYRNILIRLEDTLKKNGVTISTGASVKHIYSSENRCQITLYNGTEYVVDRTIITTAPAITGSICPQLCISESSHSLPYLGIICASLLLENPITGSYITNIADNNILFTGLIEMSALVDREEFLNKNLVYLPLYLASDDPRLKINDAELERIFIEQLNKMFPEEMRGNHIHAIKISRVPYVMPIPSNALRIHTLDISTNVPNIFQLSTANITDGVLTVDRMIELAHRSIPLLSEKDNL